MKNGASIAIFLSALILVISGCDLDSGGSDVTVANSVSACTYNVAGAATECDLYPSSFDQGSLESTCSAEEGTTSSGCNNINLLGTCSNFNNANGMVVYFYTSAGIPSQSVASTMCASESGTFSAQ